MYDYSSIIKDFYQYKQFLGYKYKTEKIVLEEIKKYLLDNNIHEITKEITENYARINPNISSNTVARNMGVFRELCNYIKHNKNINCYQIPYNIYPHNHNNYIAYVYSHDEIKRIYSNLHYINNNYHYSYYKKRIYPLIIKVLNQTGMRIGEVLNITYNNYDYKFGVFKLIDTKNNEERLVAIPEKLNDEIYNFCNKFNLKNNELIFNTNPNNVRIYFNKLLKLSNIIKTDNGPVIHDLRHTYIVHNIEKCIKNNIDVNVFLPMLQAQVGHKSLDSLSYYFHLTNDILNVTNDISEEKLGYLIPSFESGDYDE